MANVLDENLSLSMRAALIGAVTIAVLPLSKTNANASQSEMMASLHKVTGGQEPKRGRVKVKLPVLTENGNLVPIDIDIESPMTEADHVKEIHIFSEKNPVPHIATFHIGAYAGRAHVKTNIRMAGSQDITVVAVMSDGSFWSGSAESVVTAPACIDESRLE